MRERLLDLLRCPDCEGKFRAEVLEREGPEINSGILLCDGLHPYPIASGIPRMLPSSWAEHLSDLGRLVDESSPSEVRELFGTNGHNPSAAYDTRTMANFSNEWDNHDIGGRTWTMDLDDRVECFFLEPVRIPVEELKGKVVLDAGCGNGSQSVAYTRFGMEVVALDLSTGLEKGYDFRDRYKGGKPEKVHFVQADLQRAPLAKGSIDIIHSAGVLHHTPNTEKTFRALRPLLKPGGTFYVWLYKYEKLVTPLVNSMRALTRRIPAKTFAMIAELAAVPFIGFCWSVDKLGIRKYETLSVREAKIAVHDIFGAPYAYYHNFEEVAGWFRSVGINQIWPVNESRRGFGVCGRAD